MPEISDRVKESLRKGTGRALLLVREHQDIDFSDLIFNASIEAQAYDPQCESDRADYLYEIIISTKQSQVLENNLVNELLNKSIEGWDLSQLFSICKNFASKGNEKAQENLYSRFDPYDSDHGNHAIDLIDLDGLGALRFIAQARGKFLLNNPSSAWEDDSLINYTNDALSNSEALSFLQEQAINNQFIQAYLVAIQTNQEQREEYKPKDWSYDVFNQDLKADRSLFSWSRHIDQNDLLRVAQDFLNEKDEIIQRRYLKLFARIKFPFGFDSLTRFVEYNDKSVKANALRALSFFKDDLIRQIALKNIELKVYLSESLKILSENFEESDLEIVERTILEFQDNDDEDFHGIKYGVYSILANDRNIEICNTEKIIHLFKLIYSKEHCSICRKGTIELMIKYQILPQEIAEEAIFDSNPDTRELMQNLAGKE